MAAYELVLQPKPMTRLFLVALSADFIISTSIESIDIHCLPPLLLEEVGVVNYRVTQLHPESDFYGSIKPFLLGASKEMPESRLTKKDVINL
jgi:hypothetical protein